MNRSTPTAAAYEPRDAAVRPVVIGGVGLVIGVALCFGVAAWLRGGPARALPPEMSFRHGPENDSTIVRDWQAQDELVRQHLTEYAWVDRKQGMVRVPIERAMELMVQSNAREPAP